MTDHTLYLLRHAKSSWDEPLPDHQRPLSSRGVRDAGAAGRLLAANGWAADLVLCSTSVRTRETWRLASLSGARAGEVRYLDEIYEASVTRLLAVVRDTAERAGSLMLVGHGPGLPGLVDALGARPKPRDVWARLDTKYPTSGLAVLHLPGSWAGAAPAESTLVAFEIPRG